ncbi:hypothetical protein GBA52_026759 [Prunus armeniaca]|nr:hypothetical protein GBA52_026759 [Prunus armeniaca]
MGMSSVKRQMGLVVYLKRHFWLHLRPHLVAHASKFCKKRKSISRKRKDKLQSSFYPSSRHGTRSHHHVRLKSRGRFVLVVGGSQMLKSSRHLQSTKVRNVRRQARTSKRRKL